MIIHQELEEHGDDLKLLNYINTDEAERENWEYMQEVGKGFIRENGQVVGREVARIPVEEAAMLETLHDIDYLSFTLCNDKAAFRRLLIRFPHWRCSEGGI